MTGRIVVVPYDPEWPAHFATIEASLRAALSDVPVVAIEHVGSTSVPGLAAKPIIDVDVVVEAPHIAPAIAALQAVGYEHKGELGVAHRHAFETPPGHPRQNTYVVLAGSLGLRNHLAVRDTLRVRPDLAAEYATVKAALADRTDDIFEYIDGKTSVLLRILEAAGLTAAERDEIERINVL